MNLNVTSNVGFVEDSKGIKYVALAYQTNYYDKTIIYIENIQLNKIIYYYI